MASADTRLPFELIGATLAYCDSAELSTVARSSHSLRLEAELHLYRSVSLKKAGRGAALFRALSRCPDRMLYIRTLAVFDHEFSRADFSALLAMLVNLETLDLRTCADGIEARDYPFRLRELSVYADCDELPAAAFLQLLSPRLTRLEMPLSCDVARHVALRARAASDPAFTPNLQTLRAPCAVLLAFIRGGQRTALRHLRAPGTDIVEPALWTAIEESGCDIRTFSGIRTDDGYGTLQALSRVCPRLKHLELILYDGRPFTTFLLDMIDHEVNKLPPVLHDLLCFSLKLVAGNGTLRAVTPRMRENARIGLAVCFPKIVLLNGYEVALMGPSSG